MMRLFCSVLFLLLPGASLLTQMESGQNSDYTLNATNLHVVPAPFIRLSWDTTRLATERKKSLQ